MFRNHWPALMALMCVACGRGGEQTGTMSPGTGTQSLSDRPRLEGGTARAGGVGRDTAAVCVLDGDQVRAVIAQIDPASRDTTAEVPPGARIYPRLPSPYGDEREWFLHRRPIRFEGHDFYWKGPALAALPEEIKRIGILDGIPLYASKEELPGDFPIVFVPVRPGCQLQPYYYLDETESMTAGVRRPS
jgi:hypothetical protein